MQYRCVGVSFIVQSIFFEYIKSTKMIISIVSEKKTNLLHIFGWDCAYNIGIYRHVDRMGAGLMQGVKNFIYTNILRYLK